ncbi:hypothetical protein niasHT_016368 [Heterodera trifolii]|uniref:Uncharacterized protein n=1 Tax=Heterodera trifolii TaxID=157864 RepID=A0ABD2KZT8_9BILA
MANKFLIAAFLLTIAIFVNGQSEAPNNSSEMASEESNSEESGSEEHKFNPFKFRPFDGHGFFGPSSSNSSAPPPFGFWPPFGRMPPFKMPFGPSSSNGSAPPPPFAFFGRMPSLFNRPANRPSSDN